MPDVLQWFACYPEKWLGALAEMKPDVGYVYVIICLRIYEKRAPIPDSNEAIARRTGYRPSHVARIIEKLIDLGKLRRVDGGLMNPFAEQEIANGAEIALTSVKKLSRAGKKSAEKSKENQTNDATHLQLHIQKEGKDSGENLFGESDSEKNKTTKLPREWVLPQPWRLWARQQGLSDSEIDIHAGGFGPHWWSCGQRRADWFATWQKWIMNEIKWATQRATRQKQYVAAKSAQPKENWQTVRDDAESYLRNMRERALNGHEHAARADRKAISGNSVS